MIYAAAGLAEWDARLTKSVSPETEQALNLMFEIQRPNGTWGSADCWPPLPESDPFHLATVAAIAVAPGWQANLSDTQRKAGVENLKHYLRTERPPHDYGQVLLPWASARMPVLLDKLQQQTLIEMIWRHQQADGGWSIRTFAAPEAWGRGNRVLKRAGEGLSSDDRQATRHQNRAWPSSRLREAGVPAADPRIQRGLTWLVKNQRVSGRWWTRSLNTDQHHFHHI